MSLDYRQDLLKMKMSLSANRKSSSTMNRNPNQLEEITEETYEDESNTESLGPIKTNDQ